MRKLSAILLLVLLSFNSAAERGNDSSLNSQKLRLALSVQNLDADKKIWPGETLSFGTNFQVTIENNEIDCHGSWQITAVGDANTGAPPSVTVATGGLALGPSAGTSSILLPILYAGVTPDGTNNWKISTFCNGAEKKQVAFEFFEFFVDET